MSSDDNIGNKIQDFEFLSFLGEGAFSSVLKVRSLKEVLSLRNAFVL